jgi:hypothetical protein
VAVQVTIDLSVQVNAPGAACTYFDGFYHELDEAFLPGIKSHPYISTRRRSEVLQPHGMPPPHHDPMPDTCDTPGIIVATTVLNIIIWLCTVES